jgi:hypothetical protein
MESKELEVIHVSSYELFSENIFMIYHKGASKSMDYFENHTIHFITTTK